MKNMKRILLLSIVLILSIQCIAQVGMTKSEIIKKYGSNYQFVKLSDKAYALEYMSMETSMVDEKSSVPILEQYWFHYSTDVCYTYIFVSTLNDLNYAISYYDKQYVRVGDLKWKDYRTNVVIEINIHEETETFSIVILNIDL